MSFSVTTIVGNLTADPELRFTAAGRPVANFSIACTPRRFDKDKQEYVDGDTTFYNASIWGAYGENVAASLGKGQQVIAVGRMAQRSYDAADGTKRTVMDFEAEHVGPALQYATAVVTKVRRDAEGNGVARPSASSNQGSANGSGQSSAQVATATAPVATAPKADDDF